MFIDILTIFIIFIISYFIAKLLLKLTTNKVQIQEKERHNLDNSYLFGPLLVFVSYYSIKSMENYLSIEIELITFTFLLAITITILNVIRNFIFYRVSEDLLMTLFFGISYVIISGVIILVA